MTHYLTLRFPVSGSNEIQLLGTNLQGIHGLPFDTWPDKEFNKNIIPKQLTGFRGFCTHSSILFLTWHRPYLALFEVGQLQNSDCHYIFI